MQAVCKRLTKVDNQSAPSTAEQLLYFGSSGAASSAFTNNLSPFDYAPITSAGMLIAPYARSTHHASYGGIPLFFLADGARHLRRGA